MSNVIPFPGKSRETFSYLDACRDGCFVLYSYAGIPVETIGPFGTAAEAREWTIKAAGPYCGQIVIDWDSFPYEPDPKNGEVFITEWGEWRPHAPTEFAVVYLAQSVDSADVRRGFATLKAARASALRLAREHNAVLAESARPVRSAR
jgi:hypothetical protein